MWFFFFKQKTAFELRISDWSSDVCSSDLYTSDDYKRPNGQIYHTYPSLKSRADQQALWDGTLNGSISTVATDELCCSLATKTVGKRIDDTTGGNAGVEPRIAVMYTEMVGRRGASVQTFVDLVPHTAPQLRVPYPPKGTTPP